jgi:hypothetical protein
LIEADHLADYKAADGVEIDVSPAKHVIKKCPTLSRNTGSDGVFGIGGVKVAFANDACL